jgi:Zn-dependent M28 family amino/carboxypeptidase
MELNEEALDDMNLPGNYRYNDPDHPFRFFVRSDHISFARKDVPVIFYSTGTHNDYHRLADNLEGVDYKKFVEMTKLAFLLGYKAANYNGAIEVDNPMSGWQK